MAKRLVVGILAGVAVSLVAGCMPESGPLGPEQDLEVVEAQAALDCRAEVSSLSFSCTPRAPGVQGGASGVIIGGQGQYIQLSASNVVYEDNPGDDDYDKAFSADVSVRNLLDQTLGTTDGETIHPEKVRVFFHEDASSPQSGLIELAASDGQLTFLESQRDYFEYDQMIAPGKVSRPRTWKWVMNSAVQDFTFTVLVSAKVRRGREVDAAPHFETRTIDGGNQHACGLTAAGDVYCWGFNSNGQAGDSSTASPKAPTKIHGDRKFSTISTLSEHTCGLTLDGTAYCWGVNGSGRLGDGTTANRTYPVAVDVSDIPVKKFISIGAGLAHSCGLLTDSTAVCWGSNSAWQLGDNTQVTKHTPVAVDVTDLPDGKFISLSVGANFACGIATDSTAYCWGQNSDGQLGDGRTTGKGTATEVNTAEKFIAISGGVHHTCALTPAGKAYCWGFNGNGNLGTGDNTNSSSPREVDTSERFIAISVAGVPNAKDGFSCGLTADGRAFCWGSNDYGQLGTGDSVSRNVPTQVADGGKRFISIGTGYRHACATAMDGKVYCWGHKENRRLGISVDTEQPTPVLPVEMVTNFAFFARPGQESGPGYTPSWKSFEAYVYAHAGWAERSSLQG